MKLEINEIAANAVLVEASKPICLAAANAAADTTRRLVPHQDVKNVLVGETEDGAGFGIDSSFWHIWEWGSVNSPAYAPLRSGAEAAGLRFEGS